MLASQMAEVNNHAALAIMPALIHRASPGPPAGAPPDACGGCCKNAFELGTDKLFTCAGCRIVRYCSKACQRADWDGHREECRTIRKRRHAAETAGGAGRGRWWRWASVVPIQFFARR